MNRMNGMNAGGGCGHRRGSGWVSVIRVSRYEVALQMFPFVSALLRARRNRTPRRTQIPGGDGMVWRAAVPAAAGHERVIARCYIDGRMGLLVVVGCTIESKILNNFMVVEGCMG